MITTGTFKMTFLTSSVKKTNHGSRPMISAQGTSLTVISTIFSYNPSRGIVLISHQILDTIT
jgi:hypothetical protein